MDKQEEAAPEFAGLLYRQTRNEAPGLAVAGLVFAFLCHEHVNNRLLVGWVVAVALIIGVRLWLAGLYRSRGRRHKQRPRNPAWYYGFIAGAGLLGAAFGGLAFLAVRHADIQAAGVLLFWLAFVTICTVPIYGGIRAPVLAFAVPALLPASLSMLARGNTQASAIGVIMLVALGLTIFASRALYRVNNRMLALEDDVQQMRGVLEARRAEIDKLNQSVRLNNERRQQAENEAKRASADLGLMKSKAQALSETLSRVSPLCPVTGIANRRTFEEHLDAEWRRQMRAKRPLSLLMCEIDEFDHYREAHGVQAADAMLHRIARLAAAVGRRPGDLAARYDGAGIAILLPDCDGRNAVRIADALRKRIEQQKIPHEVVHAGQTLTAHVGVATLIPIKDYEPAELVKRIDTALYEARFQGGNCVVSFRTMDKLKVEHWDPKTDDLLSKQSMLQKIMIRGYKCQPVGYPPSSVLPDKNADVETVCALYQGEMKLIIEGESMLLRAGDCIYIPPATTWGAEVVSARDVLGFEGVRTN